MKKVLKFTAFLVAPIMLGAGLCTIAFAATSCAPGGSDWKKMDGSDWSGEHHFEDVGGSIICSTNDSPHNGVDGYATITSVQKDQHGYGWIGDLIIPQYVSSDNGLHIYEINAIGSNAFFSDYDYGVLDIRTVDLGSVKTIGETAFYDCGDISYLNLRNVESIGKEAFMGCGKIRNLKIPQSCATIGDEAFANLNSLDRLDLSNFHGTIGDYAFSNSYVNSINLSNFAVADCSVINTSETQAVYRTNDKSIVGSLFQGSLNQSVKSTLGINDTIGNEQFLGCTAISSIDLTGITNIGYAAFAPWFYVNNDSTGIKKISSLDFANVVTIGAYAFMNSALTSITIPASCTSIGVEAFQNDLALTSITLPSGNITLGAACFAGSDQSGAGSIKEITIVEPLINEPNNFGYNTFWFTCDVGEFHFSKDSTWTELSVIDHYFNNLGVMTHGYYGDIQDPTWSVVWD